MSHEYSEDKLVEQTCIKLFQNSLGWETVCAYNSEIFGEDGTLGRVDKREVILKPYFLEKLKQFNPDLPEQAYTNALDILLEDSVIKSTAELNRDKYKLLRDGIQVDFINDEGKPEQKKLKIFDFEHAENNHFLAVSQLWIEGKSRRERRPDIIGFVNGIPLLFIELKAVHRKLENAYNQNLTDYKDTIPRLFYCNAFVILSNGLESRIGSITGRYQHFHEWKRIAEDDNGVVALDRIIKGVCEKSRFMDMFENFVLYDDSLGKIIKLIARNHQFIGVNKAIANIMQKEQEYKDGLIEQEEKQKLGVFWHTQGSGKSYSMVFMCQKLLQKYGNAYTFLIVTDRVELDKQIYGTFSGVGAVPEITAGNKNAIRAKSGKHLKKLLQQNHRYIFSIIHKFNFTEAISQRDNIIVISDEAHRTQGGTLAMNMRKALPNASFIGFTGTPLFKDDELTRRIFGDYVSRYDFKRSVDDHATVPLFYENRGEYLKLKNPVINQQIRDILDEEEDNLTSDQRSRLEQLFQRDYPILTSQKRLDAIAKDIVWHFCNRGYKGKAMIVCIDKITCVKMYDLISKHWAENIKKTARDIQNEKGGDQELLDKKRDLDWNKETEIAVVISSEQNEIKRFTARGLDIEPHRAKMNDASRDLEQDFKNDEHPFRLAIVCAMWITGFDVPTLSTMYIDKPLKSHTLMQTIARANRISEGKNNGMIVDYIETYKALLDALAIYGSNEGKEGDNGETEAPVKPKEELTAELEEALEATEEFLSDELGFDTKDMIEAEGLDKIAALENGLEAIYTTDETKRKFCILAREVFKKFKAIMPDPVLYEYAARKNAIDALYSTIMDNTTSADVSEIMKKIQDIVDASIETMISAPPQKAGNIIDLSNMDFVLLERLFLKTKHKNTVVQSLKDLIEAKLKKMVNRNPMLVDYYQRYQEIIEEYNLGKDKVAIEETFRQLMEFMNSLSEEEAERHKEGLTEEQKAIFDILQKPALTPTDKKKVKELAVELLEVLKNDTLKIDRVWEKIATSSAVYAELNQFLFNRLPYPTYVGTDIDDKTDMVFNHLKNQYYGGGQSVYGAY